MNGGDGFGALRELRRERRRERRRELSCNYWCFSSAYLVIMVLIEMKLIDGDGESVVAEPLLLLDEQHGAAPPGGRLAGEERGLDAEHVQVVLQPGLIAQNVE